MIYSVVMTFFTIVFLLLLVNQARYIAKHKEEFRINTHDAILAYIGFFIDLVCVLNTAYFIFK